MTDKKTENASKPKGLTKEELTSMISAVASEAAAKAVESHVAPLKAQQSEWMEKIRHDFKRANLVQKDDDKGIAAARFVRALAYGKGDPGRAKHFAQKSWDDDMGAMVIKTMEAGDFTSGGALLPETFAAEIIEFLRAKTVVRAAGARTLPMNQGSITIRRQTGTVTATYIGEAENITKTEPTVGQLRMTAKKLAALVPISNDLLRFDAGDTADRFVRDDLVMSMARTEDTAFVRNTGTENAPRGIRYWMQTGNVLTSNGTTATQIEDDFKDLINALETNDAPMVRPVWFMNPRSKNHLINLRDANGNLIYPEVRTLTPTLYGYPVFTTTNIPTNLGGGTETEIYLADMNECIIAEVMGMEIAVDSSASYVESGSLVSSFSRDETVIRAITQHDFGMRHVESAAVITNATWGA